MEKKKDGHNQLIGDLQEIWLNANENEYHDFQNEKYATPKVALVNHLQRIINKVKNGDYDNQQP